MGFVIVVGLSAMVALAGCGRKKITFASDVGQKWSAETDKSLNAEVVWLKNKKDTIDVLMAISNLYEEPVVIKSHSIRLRVDGGRSVQPRDSSERVLYSNDVKKMVLIFDFIKEIPKEVTAEIKIDPIYKWIDGKDGEKLPPIQLVLPVK